MQISYCESDSSDQVQLGGRYNEFVQIPFSLRSF